MTMDATPNHLDDEILSALLDGDADPDAATHLRACGRCAGRQAELAAARAALAGTPVEPLDELTRRRLVAGALQAADKGAIPAAAAGPARDGRPRWASRHPAFIGSAAAALLALLVGVPFVVGDNGGPAGDAGLSAEAPSALQESASPFLGDLGDLSDHDRLRLRLSGAGTGAALGYSAPQEPGASPAGGASSPAPAPAAAPTAGGLAGSPRARTAAPESGTADSATSTNKAAPDQPAQGARNTATDAFAADQAAGRDRADTDACVAALLNGPARGGRLVASGTGMFQGRPAIVAAFDLSGGTVAFIADRSGCAVLDRFSV